MRKVFALILILVLAGCGGGSADPLTADAIRREASELTPRAVASKAFATENAAAGLPLPTPDQLFNWAEKRYPDLLPAGGVTLNYENFLYRFYSATNLYAGVAEENVFILGAEHTGGQLIKVGSLRDFASVITLANAGPDRVVQVNQPLPLSAMGSYPLTATLKWSVLSSPPEGYAQIVSTSDGEGYVTFPRPGRYVLNLLAQNAGTDTDQVAVQVEPLSSAPSSPSDLVASAVTSNSITLNWSPSLGGLGGIATYQVYLNGTSLGDVNASADVTEYTFFMNAASQAKHQVSVVAHSVSGATSYPAEVQVQTASIAELLSKMTPFILFHKATGQIEKQGYLSPMLLAKASTLPSGDGRAAVFHPRVDHTQFGVRATGNGKFEVFSLASGQPASPPIDAPVFSKQSSSVAWRGVNLSNGVVEQRGLAGSSGIMSSIRDGTAAYFPGEAL